MDLYRKQYADLQFERAGLFEAIQRKYGGDDVLYPGCSIHIAPSFYFPHVVYVDLAPAAELFFRDAEGVLGYVNRRRRYRRPAYVRFIAADLAEPLPLPEGSFELLISLFTGGIARSCKRYLRVGGILLTDNHHGDAMEAAADDEFRLIATVRYRQGGYRLDEDSPPALPRPRVDAARTKRYLRRAVRGLEYVENEEYYVFRRGLPRA